MVEFKSYFFIFLTIITITSCKKEKKISLDESLTFIAQELNKNNIDFYASYEGKTISYTDVSFLITNRNTCECQYTYTFKIDQSTRFNLTQEFNLTDIKSVYYSKPTSDESNISLLFSKKSAKHIMKDFAGKPGNFGFVPEEWMNQVNISINKNQKEKLINAFNSASRLCKEKNNKDLFND